MSITINIHPFFCHLTNDQDVVEVDGSSVGQCLEHLIAQFPETKKWLLGKDGNLLSLVDIYVNGESAYPEELAKPVKDGDELHIIVFIAGG